MNAKAHLLGMAGMAMLSLAACSNEEDQAVFPSDDEITFNTRVSRAENTTIGSLKDFFVYADADQSPMFINGKKAVKKGDNNSTIYQFETPQYWPTGVNLIRFWAFGPTDIAGLTPNFTADGQSFGNYTPATGTDNPGAKHRDLVVAYATVDRSNAQGTNVSLNFHHAMSRISVKAKSGNTDGSRIVKVKGAWIVNPKATGSLAFDEKETASNYAKWTTDAKRGIYGLQIAENTLSPSTTNLIGGSDQSDLLLIPQTTAKWNMNKSETEADNATEGAYILVLCRVEFKHPGEYHADDGTTDAGAIHTPTFPEGTDEADKYHLHQVFPNTGNYAETEFGYTCVPIDIDWKPGYKYEYTLTFCGQNSGAGVYPPTDLDPTLPEGEPTPDDKKPGDLVLNDPISFEVSVSGWTDGTSGNGGDIEMN